MMMTHWTLLLTARQRRARARKRRRERERISCFCFSAVRRFVIGRWFCHPKNCCSSIIIPPSFVYFTRPMRWIEETNLVSLSLQISKKTRTIQLFVFERSSSSHTREEYRQTVDTRERNRKWTRTCTRRPVSLSLLYLHSESEIGSWGTQIRFVCLFVCFLQICHRWFSHFSRITMNSCVVQSVSMISSSTMISFGRSPCPAVVTPCVDSASTFFDIKTNVHKIKSPSVGPMPFLWINCPRTIRSWSYSTIPFK